MPDRVLYGEQLTVAETLDGVYSTLDFWIGVLTQSFACFAPLREKNFVDSL
jgi:hypothetical protein